MKTLIKNGLVLLWDESGWKIEQKNILIDGSRIASVTVGACEDADRVIDAEGKLRKFRVQNAKFRWV